MTSDGTNSYSWDCENRMIKITYPGTNNYSTFAYDALGRNVSIVETVSGSVTSTKQFVWSKNRDEERDASGNVKSQYFKRGQQSTGTNFYYTLDHSGSIRELTSTAGAVSWQASYDPWGKVATIQGSNQSDFQYAGYYTHVPSGLNLTVTRLYNAGFGRFFQRDPIEEEGGINLYDYADDDPIGGTDPDGTLVTGMPAGASPPSASNVGGIIGGAGGAPPPGDDPNRPPGGDPGRPPEGGQRGNQGTKTNERNKEAEDECGHLEGDAKQECICDYLKKKAKEARNNGDGKLACKYDQARKAAGCKHKRGD